MHRPILHVSLPSLYSSGCHLKLLCQWHNYQLVTYKQGPAGVASFWRDSCFFTASRFSIEGRHHIPALFICIKVVVLPPPEWWQILHQQARAVIPGGFNGTPQPHKKPVPNVNNYAAYNSIWTCGKSYMDIPISHAHSFLKIFCIEVLL